MAVDDLVFCEGDRQNFILEIPNIAEGTLVEIILSASITNFILEIPIGTLNAPIDWLTDPFSSHAILFNNLTLVGGTGATYFAF